MIYSLNFFLQALCVAVGVVCTYLSFSEIGGGIYLGFIVLCLVFAIQFFMFDKGELAYRTILIFLSFCSLYFFIGAIPFFDLIPDFSDEYYSHCYIFILSVYSILILFPKKKTVLVARDFPSGLFWLSALFTLLCVLFFWAQIKGVPILMGEDARREGSALAKVLAQAFYLFICLLVAFQYKRIRLIVLLILSVLIALSGYRTPLIQGVVIFGLVFYVYKGRKVKLSAVVAVILMFLIINAISGVRLYTEYGEKKLVDNLDKLGFMSNNPVYYPAATILFNFKESPNNYRMILDWHSDFGYGKYFLGNVGTMFGSGKSYGDLYNEMTAAESERSKTATILAPFYIELGVSGIVLGGMCVSLFTLLLLRVRANVFFVFIQAYWISSMLIWIHNGSVLQTGNIVILFLFLGLCFLYDIFLNMNRCRKNV